MSGNGNPSWKRRRALSSIVNLKDKWRERMRKACEEMPSEEHCAHMHCIVWILSIFEDSDAQMVQVLRFQTCGGTDSFLLDAVWCSELVSWIPLWQPDTRLPRC